MRDKYEVGIERGNKRVRERGRVRVNVGNVFFKVKEMCIFFNNYLFKFTL